MAGTLSSVGHAEEKEDKTSRMRALARRTIAEVAGIKPEEILYFSPSNRALAHLPYMIALDKCVPALSCCLTSCPRTWAGPHG